MLRAIILLLVTLCGAGQAWGQIFGGPWYTEGTIVKLKDPTKTVAIPTTVLPATCTVGSLAFLTVGDIGLYTCLSTNTWTKAGSGGGSCPKYTVAYNDAALGVAQTAANKALVTLAANSKITGITVKERTQFAGTGVTKLTISLGRTGTETEYLAAFDLLQVPSATNMVDIGGHFGATMDSHAVQARFTATGGNLNALTAGSVDIWVCSAVLP